RDHDRGDARSDDVTYTEQRGIVFDRDRAAFERFAEDFARILFPRLKDLLDAVVKKTDTEAADDRLAASHSFIDNRSAFSRSFKRGGARFIGSTGLQHFGAGSAFGIFEKSMLSDDERASQRNHHQDAEQAAEHRNQHHAR